MFRELPHDEIDYNDDYQRWQFEAARAEWEAEQQRSCFHETARLYTMCRLNKNQPPVRVVSCRDCGQVLGGEIE